MKPRQSNRANLKQSAQRTISYGMPFALTRAREPRSHRKHDNDIPIANDGVCARAANQGTTQAKAKTLHSSLSSCLLSPFTLWQNVLVTLKLAYLSSYTHRCDIRTAFAWNPIGFLVRANTSISECVRLLCKVRPFLYFFLFLYQWMDIFLGTLWFYGF